MVEINVNRNRISDIAPQLSQCPRLKTLRLEENCLSITGKSNTLFETFEFRFHGSHSLIIRAFIIKGKIVVILALSN